MRKLKVKEKKVKNKNKKIIIAISVMVIIILGIVVFLVLNFHKNVIDKKDNNSEIVIKLIDNLDVEINSEVNLLSFINNSNDLDIISNDENVDTSILGEKELSIKYNDKGEEKEYKFVINIKDTTIPVIECPEELTTTVGIEIDLLKDVVVTDNSKEGIKATVEGEYDFNKEGTYTLKYIAKDSSNNKTEKEFNLKVNKKEEIPANNSQTVENSSSNTSSSSNKTPPKNVNPSKEWVDFDLSIEEGKPTNYKYGTKVTEVKEFFVLKYGDNTTEKIYADSDYKLDTSSYNGNTKSILSEATKIVDSNLSLQNEMLKYVNEYRAEKGVAPLTIDRNLSIAATVRTIEMAYSGKFSHERPNMSGNDSCFTVLSELGINRSTLGENISGGNATAKDTAVQWRNSSGHYANMIDSKFKKIGIGIFKENASKYKYYWTQIFSD